MNPRAIAAIIIEQVSGQGRSLSQALESFPDGTKSQHSLVQEMCYGVFRDYYRLQNILNGLLKKPLKSKDGDVRALLLVGLYQLHAMRVPDHAGVSETVAATQELKKDWARGLVNGILRRFLREKDQRIEASEQTEEARWSHPQWLVDQIRSAWPALWQSVLEQNNQRPPMTLRVNLSQISRDDYLADLETSGIIAIASPQTPSAIYLAQPCDVGQLPGFYEGRVSVQDEAAQLAAGLLELDNEQRVLDVCAAPGGKSGHILEMANVELVAIDVDPKRLEKVKQNLDRLCKKASLLVGDARHPESWYDGHQFDRILLDAPCSATGVIRRHPDIKVLRRAEDIQSLVELQAEILETVWPLLKPGGMLVYATCSVLPCENSEQLAAFVEKKTDASSLDLRASWGRPAGIGRQILPGDGSSDNGIIRGMDGFYYACLKKLF
jgi:16S rRNA (cytosine967-C5)-methyltransferase